MSTVRDAAALLLPAWHDPSRRIESLPPPLRPADAAGAYAIQAAVSAALGPIGGWKVGSPGPDKGFTCAPLPANGIIDSPAELPSARWTLRGIESEIAVRIAHNLPPRPTPYTRDEVLAAVASCHPVIEVLQSRFLDHTTLDPMTSLADSLAHGGLVVGPAIDGWTHIDLSAERIEQIVDGAVGKTGTGNPAGDMIRLIEWLANEGSHWAGGLKAGQIVTTGSWTGAIMVGARAKVRAAFAHAGDVHAEFVE